MIRIVGKSDIEDENIAAEHLRTMFLKWRPDIDTNDDDVLILVSVQTPGNRGQQDIDLVVLGRLRRPLNIKWSAPRQKEPVTVPMWSFCTTIEVKGHELRTIDGRPQITFTDNKVDVLYGGEWHPASLQASGQGKAFASRLKKELQLDFFLTSFVWLVRVSDGQIKGKLNEPNAVLPANFDIPTLGWRILEIHHPRYSSETGKFQYSIWVRDLDFNLVAKRLSASFEASPLDRSRVDSILKRRIDFSAFQDLGKQQIIVSGPAGSGKTIVLLRTALDFMREGKRIAVLTYNRTLVADIQRLLMFLKAKGASSRPNINVMTLHSFFRAVIKTVFADEDVSDNSWFDDIYPQRLREIRDLLRAGAASRSEIKRSLIAQDFAIFDIACVDEGQDWLDVERDVLQEVIGSENCIVAAGFDQLVRQDTVCDWTRGGEVSTSITRLRKCLRMKSALAAFTNSVAIALGLNDWVVEADDELAGGNVIIVTGSYASHRALHENLVSMNKRAGNANLDMLFCVEPGNIRRSPDGSRRSELGNSLLSWGCDVWDATDDANRDDPPKSVDVFRIVQCESCRGLEGWLVVAEHLDSFFEGKLRQWKRDNRELSVSFLRDDAGDAARLAALWSMIPMTRAIDTLVLTLRDPNSTFGHAALEAARRLPDIVRVY